MMSSHKANSASDEIHMALRLATLLTAQYFTLVCIGFLNSMTASAQEVEVLLLPENTEREEELGRVGTRRNDYEFGLSRISNRDTNTTYIVVDLQEYLHDQITDQLANIYLNDSDISIRKEWIRGEFIHLRVEA